MKGESFPLNKETIFVGRSSKNDIQIKDRTISRKQLKIFKVGKKIFIEDLKSTNGTIINGEIITPGEGFEVGETDRITIGDTTFRIADASEQKKAALVEKDRPLGVENTQEYQHGPQGRQERRSLARNMKLVFNLGEMLKSTLTLNELCEKVLDFLFDTLPRIDRATIALFDPDGLKITIALSKTRAKVPQGGSPYNRKILEETLKKGKSIRMSNTEFEGSLEVSDTSKTLRIKSLLCVPMVSNNQVRGALYVDSLGGPYGFRKEDLILLNSLSGSIALAVENILLHERLKKHGQDQLLS